MPGMAVTKSVVANDTSGKKREEVFVDIIEKISVTFNASVSVAYPLSMFTFLRFSMQSCVVSLVFSHGWIHKQFCCIILLSYAFWSILRPFLEISKDVLVSSLPARNYPDLFANIRWR